MKALRKAIALSNSFLARTIDGRRKSFKKKLHRSKKRKCEPIHKDISPFCKEILQKLFYFVISIFYRGIEIIGKSINN